MASKKRTNAHDPVRMIGERVETIEIRLTQKEIEDEREKVIDLLQQRDTAESEWENKKAANKAVMKGIDSRIEAARGAIRRGRREEEIVIQEWLTRQNEVIKIDRATNLEVGRRNATREELQEDLPLSDPNVKADGNDEGDAELDKEVAADFGEDA